MQVLRALLPQPIAGNMKKVSFFQTFYTAAHDLITIVLFSVVLLENMVGVNEVDPYLEEEVAEECSRYGQVLRVLVHVLGEATASATVRIFVHFDSREAAVGAVQGLNNRFFGGRQIVARLYPDEEFQMRKLNL